MSVASVALVLGTSAPNASAVDFDELRERAREASLRPYEKPPQDLPPVFAKLGLREYESIRHRPGKALWDGTELPFTVELFHRGFLYDEPVRVHTVDGAGVDHLIPFEPSAFVYSNEEMRSAASKGLEHAGFRLRYPLNGGETKDEFLVFLGASYFRAVAREQVYGASARGLAIDTASPHGEEFPRFTDFWIHEPAPNAEAILVKALLDGPSITGAYAFRIRPGSPTVIEVRASLYPRREIAKLGIAPLTSMFLYGENRVRYFADFREEVHDSDGLLFRGDDGEWSWRPLWNPTGEHRVTRYPMTNPSGFGLLQRDRDPGNYLDLEQKFESRPSLWVEPEGTWGEGFLELVEIPTHHDSNDNVVAFWVPKKQTPPGEPLDVRYRLVAYDDDASRPPMARTTSTRVDPEGPEKTQFVVEFGPPWLPDLPDDAPMEADVSAEPGKVSNVRVTKNPTTGGWRLTFVVEDGPKQALHLEASLRLGDRVVTETWRYAWPGR